MAVAAGETTGKGSPMPSTLSVSSDILDEHWYGGNDAGSYYSPEVLLEPLDIVAQQDTDDELTGVETP